MNLKLMTAACVALLATAAKAAPGQGDPVAEGYVDWSGVVSKNFVMGRLITPSDLRHKAVVYVVLDGSKLTHEVVEEFCALPGIAPVPASHATQWETQELPRSKIVVFSVRNMGKMTQKEFAEFFRPPKGAETKVIYQYRPWTENKAPFYKDLKPVGEANMADDKLPYVAVYGGEGTEPLYAKEKWTPAEMKNVNAAVRKAVSGLGPWKAPLGVEDPQFFKKVAADMAKGKPAQALLPQLKAGIKSKNPDQAKEAQIMFDALNQYKSDLMLRIQLELHSAPARAYYDFNTLVKNFPSEKKNLQAVDAKMKANKEIGALGKIFEKMMLWGRDDYVCKNAAEAKKNVQELQKYRKMLDVLATSQNAQLQGEAMLFQSQIDALIEIMPTKVPMK